MRKLRLGHIYFERHNIRPYLFLNVNAFFQVENVQLKFVLLLQQHISTTAAGRTTAPSADSDIAVTEDQAAASGGSSSSDLVRLLMVPAILRQMVELAQEMLLI